MFKNMTNTKARLKASTVELTEKIKAQKESRCKSSEDKEKKIATFTE